MFGKRRLRLSTDDGEEMIKGGSLSKRIRLTWKPTEELEIEEECLLLEEDTPLYIDGTDGPIQIDGSVMRFFAKTNRVIFEDSEGIFGLTPDQIVNIEVIDG